MMDGEGIPTVNEVNPSNCCLLCQERNGKLLEIFGTEGIELNIATILQDHLRFEIYEPVERHICETCWKKVESFNEFYHFVKCKREEKCFGDSKLIEVVVHPELIQDIQNIKNEPFTDYSEYRNESTESDPMICAKEEIEEEDNDDDDDVDDATDSDSSEEQETLHLKRKRRKSPTTSTETKAKKCKTDSYSSLLSEYFKMMCDLCGVALSSYRDTKDHYKTIHDHEKGYLVCCSKKFYRLQNMLQHCEWHVNPESFKCSDCPKTFSNKYRLRDHTNHCHIAESEKVYSCDECKKTFSKKHYLSAHLKKGHKSMTTEENPVRKPRVNFEKQHEMIRKRFLMQCDLCCEPYTMFRDAQLHHLKDHNQAGYLYCCDRKFFKMYKAVQHCLWHDNPEAFKCSFCQKCFSDKVGLRDHTRNVHSPEEERLFQCDICRKSFTKSYLLRSHMRVNHVKDEDKKFECHICGIRFVIDSFLQSHINRVHQNVHSHICELCAKPFKSGKSYEHHYITAHTNISQKVQCDMCGKWLKHKASLKKHIQWHNSKTETCGVCGRVSTNIRALRAHIRSAHQVASLECTICGKMFKKQQVLKEHMAIHAGITDLYKCTFCTKTFRSNANMYSHRKRAHPVELERKKTQPPPGH